MNIYLTNGTDTVLKKIVEAHEEETMVLMQNIDTCLLVHETGGSTLFKEPRKYEVIDTLGSIKVDSGYAAFEHIPVTDEGKPLFEYHYKNQINVIEKQLGFQAIRILRPHSSSDTHIVFTLWKNEADYKIWRSSDLYEKVSLKFEAKKGKKGQTKILLRPSFIRTYTIYKDNE